MMHVVDADNINLKIYIFYVLVTFLNVNNFLKFIIGQCIPNHCYVWHVFDLPLCGLHSSETAVSNWR